MKGGKLRKPGEVMEMVEEAAALLAEKGVLEIPGKKVVRVKETVDVVKIVDAK
jgi:hypothetical protein